VLRGQRCSMASAASRHRSSRNRGPVRSTPIVAGGPSEPIPAANTEREALAYRQVAECRPAMTLGTESGAERPSASEPAETEVLISPIPGRIKPASAGGRSPSVRSVRLPKVDRRGFPLAVVLVLLAPAAWAQDYCAQYPWSWSCRGPWARPAPLRPGLAGVAAAADRDGALRAAAAVLARGACPSPCAADRDRADAGDTRSRLGSAICGALCGDRR
jgi:hypothetical protein